MSHEAFPLAEYITSYMLGKSKEVKPELKKKPMTEEESKAVWKEIFESKKSPMFQIH